MHIVHRNGQPGKIDGISPKNEGIHDFADKQKCEDTKFVDVLRFPNLQVLIY